MNSEVFRALLALDSYNRDYNAGIEGLEGNALGNATIIKRDGFEPAQDIGFYAIGLFVNDETIISFRGTDEIDGDAWPPANGSDAL
jgi:hypothetical protein